MIVILGFLGDALEFVAGNAGAIFGGAGSAALAVGGWLGAKFVAPFLRVEKRKKYAQWIAVIADEITDALLARYPNKAWLERLDESVDELARVCGVDVEISRRAIEAALARKNQARV